MPPSPVVIDLRGWNEKAATSPEPARWPAAQRRAGRAGGILDDRARARAAAARRASMSAHSPNRCTAMTALVRGVTRASDVGDIDVERCAVDVGEHRRRPAIQHDVGRRDPGEGGNDDLVARADRRAPPGQDAGPSCTRSSRNACVDAVALGERLLERGDLGPLGQPAGLTAARAAPATPPRRWTAARSESCACSWRRIIGQPRSRARRASTSALCSGAPFDQLGAAPASGRFCASKPISSAAR